LLLPRPFPDVYVRDVNAAPPDSSAPPRRKRSRQRDRILDWLRSTDVHPTAAQIHAALSPDMPSLSLGTVYRNLEVLVADGEVDEVSSATGAARYDGNLEPHHHFNCERCGRILDVEISIPRSLTRRLASEHGLRARRVRLSCFGLCPECDDGKNPSHLRASAARNDSTRNA
jgi:Fe2+ or Zn2+ uptake regulation protein